MKINLLSDEKTEELDIVSTEEAIPEDELLRQEEQELGASEVQDVDSGLEEGPVVEETETEEAVLSEPSFASYDEEESGPSKKKFGIYALLFASIIAISALVYYWFVLRPTGDEKPFFPPPDQIAETTTDAEVPDKDATVGGETVADDLTAFDKDVLISIQGGVSIIQGINNLLPDDVNISMLTYHGDQSLTIQCVAHSADKLNSFFQALQSEFPGTTMKSNVDHRVVGGQTVRRMTISASGFELQQPTYATKVEMLDVSQLKSRMEQLATTAGIKISSVSGGTRSFSGAEIVRTPISIRMSGPLNAELSFLNDLATTGLNIKFSKVMLLSSERRAPSRGNIDLILYLELVKPS